MNRWEVLADVNVIVVGPLIVGGASWYYGGAPWWAALLIGILVGGPFGKLMHIGIVRAYEAWESAFGTNRTPTH